MSCHACRGHQAAQSLALAAPSLCPSRLLIRPPSLHPNLHPSLGASTTEWLRVASPSRLCPHPVPRAQRIQAPRSAPGKAPLEIKPAAFGAAPVTEPGRPVLGHVEFPQVVRLIPGRTVAERALFQDEVGGCLTECQVFPVQEFDHVPRFDPVVFRDKGRSAGRGGGGKGGGREGGRVGDGGTEVIGA